MSQEDLLADIATCLEKAQIPFMVCGSHSSSFHGEPRATNDADLVIDPTEQQLEQFLALLGDRYYVSLNAAREALRRRSLFNIIDWASGWKADLIIRKSRAFSEAEFRRRQLVILHGRPIPLAAPEDVILTKLEWNKITPSERQVNDALGVAVVQWGKLDQSYLRKWAADLGVLNELESILRTASERNAQGQSETP